jgi:predicted alpha/beta superfamily hydrolase
MEYQTRDVLRRQLRIRYPAGEGTIVLRTELDWDLDVEPVAVDDHGETSTFDLAARRPFLYFKPCLRTPGGELRWAVGDNRLALMTTQATRDVFPYFHGSDTCSLSEVFEVESKILGRNHLFRVYLPPGYEENPLRRFTTLYMQDGKNLFFPEEAFLGRAWEVDDALDMLGATNAIDRVAVVGIHSADRMHDYTKPGYEAYARAVVEEVKPEVDRRIRVLGGPRETGVIGSSLGGVVSFFMAWQYPGVFGFAGCMSSTFSFRDDLIDRVLSEPRSPSRFYLDSGWPRDNYEVTLAMAMAFSHRGYRQREEFLHLVFPHERHDERAWGRRLHIPFQLGLGVAATAARRSTGDPASAPRATAG